MDISLTKRGKKIERSSSPLGGVQHCPGGGIAVNLLEAVEHAKAHGAKTVEIPIAIHLRLISLSLLPAEKKVWVEVEGCF